MGTHNTPRHLPEAEAYGDYVLSSAGTGTIQKGWNKICSPQPCEKCHQQFASGFTDAKMRRIMGIFIGKMEGNKYGSMERSREGERKGGTLTRNPTSIPSLV